MGKERSCPRIRIHCGCPPRLIFSKETMLLAFDLPEESLIFGVRGRLIIKSKTSSSDRIITNTVRLFRNFRINNLYRRLRISLSGISEPAGGFQVRLGV